MRKVIMTTVAIAGIALASLSITQVSAMGHKNGVGPLSDKGLERLQNKLELSDDQVADIKAYNAEQLPQLQTAVGTLKETREALSKLDPKSDTYEAEYKVLAEQLGEATEQMAILHSQHKQTLAGVLTPEQLDKLDMLKKARHDKKEERFQKHASFNGHGEQMPLR